MNEDQIEMLNEILSNGFYLEQLIALDNNHYKLCTVEQVEGTHIEWTILGDGSIDKREVIKFHSMNSLTIN